MGCLIGWLLYPIGWIINKINPFPVEEYFCNYVKPRIERAHALGIPDDEIKAMWDKAWDIAPDLTSPAIWFDNMIDNWELEHKTKVE